MINNFYKDEKINVNNFYKDEKINVNNFYKDEKINVNNFYQEKYLKYKQKYIKLKIGGADLQTKSNIVATISVLKQKLKSLGPQVATINKEKTQLATKFSRAEQTFLALKQKLYEAEQKLYEAEQTFLALKQKLYEAEQKLYEAEQTFLALKQKLYEAEQKLFEADQYKKNIYAEANQAREKLIKLDKQIFENIQKLKEYNHYLIQYYIQNFYYQIISQIKINPIEIKNLEEFLINLGEKIGSGTYSKIYLYTENDNKYVLSLQHEPTYDVNEIELLLYLNTIKLDDLKTSVFSEFINVYFDFDKLQYYLCYKYYTGDLYQYLLFLNNKLKSLDLECTSNGISDSKSNDTSDSIKSILNKIEEDLNIKFKKLLQINYICLDIKLQNILVSYNESEIDYTELVLHDYDLTSCCQKSIIQNCKIHDNEKIYLEIYYKLIIYFQCKHYKNNKTKMPHLPALLYEEYFKNINDESFQSFFDYILQDMVLPEGVIPEDLTHKRIYFFFHYYITSTKTGFLRYYDIQILSTNSKQLCKLIKDIINNKISYIVT